MKLTPMAEPPGSDVPRTAMLLAVHQQALFQGLVDLAAQPDSLHGEQQQGGDDEAHGGRNNERA